MRRLQNAEAYPPSVRIALEAMMPVATQIANRWMRDWPEQTRRLIDASELLAALALETAWVQEQRGRGILALGRRPLAHLRPPPATKSR